MSADRLPDTTTGAALALRLREALDARGIDESVAALLLDHFIKLRQDIETYLDEGGAWRDARGQLFLTVLSALARAHEDAVLAPDEPDAVIAEVRVALAGLGKDIVPYEDAGEPVN